MIYRHNPAVWLLLFLFVTGLAACRERPPVDNEARIATRVAEELAVAATLTASAVEAQPDARASTDTPRVTTEVPLAAAARADAPPASAEMSAAVADTSAMLTEAPPAKPTVTKTLPVVDIPDIASSPPTTTPVLASSPPDFALLSATALADIQAFLTAGIQATASPPPAGCGNATAPRLIVGERALMVDSVANTLRLEPRRDGSRVGAISRGALVDVLAGPVCDQGTPPRFYYWLVRTDNGIAGWTAEGEKGVYWLEPAENADAPSSMGSELAINLRPSCGKQQHASRADQITLKAFWGVKGYDLALMSDDVVNITIQLDGQRLASSRLSAPLSESEVPCGTGLRDSYWLVESAYVGQLAPGRHLVTVRYTFGKQVTDGFDDNGDGRPDSYGPGGDTEQFATEYVLIVQ